MRYHTRAAIAAALLLCVLITAAEPKVFAANNDELAAQSVQEAPDASFDLFLDHLMRAESNGRDAAANPRSTALGAFQFIESTFVAVAREHFSREVAELSDKRVLELRTNREFARRAAAAYCKENAAYLAEQGLRPTFGHLRLAYLLGAGGAAKVLKAPPQTPIKHVLSPAVIRANPFMKGMTVAGLTERAHRDIRRRTDVVAATPEKPEVETPHGRKSDPGQGTRATKPAGSTATSRKAAQDRKA